MKTVENILVTGVDGFVGGHMTELLASNGHHVIGVGRSAEAPAYLADKINEYHICDLTEPDQVAKLPLKQVDAVINLAGIATNRREEKDAERVMRTNVLVHTVLYQAFLDAGATPRIVAVSSGAIYDPTASMPLSESSPLTTAAATPYIASKLAMEKALDEQFAGKLDVVVARPFNHIGSRQGPGFLLPDWAQRLWPQPPTDAPDVSVLGSYRDITVVDDVVEAYYQLLTADRDRLDDLVYNICSGTPTLIYDIVRQLAHELEYELPPFDFAIDNKIFGDPSRMAAATGWHQKTPLSQGVTNFATWYKETHPR